MNYTYIVRCSDGTYYTGWTNDIEKRIKSHNNKTGAKYTRTRTPVILVYLEESETKEGAMSREYAIKRMTRKQKEELIRSFHKDISSVSDIGQT
ncbi:MAG: GIY-YIG nuclease family protein [Eubacteriales bacterium]|nr:GIY-YIG nuclease family protein [Eubacteriales bacterium]